MKRYLRLLTSFLLAGYMSMLTVCAQEDLPYQVPSVPTSPQAEAFKRYGDVAVNPGTGVPDISIPLFEINHHGYRLPLALRYSPSPVSPGYNYDVFGRGWALSVSSCISRSIEGMPDERAGFKLEMDKLNIYYRVSPEIPTGLNLKYDLFSAILPDGSSFDFVIMKNYQGKIQYIVSGGRKVKISYTSTVRDITAFKVIDEQGIEYDFSGADTSYSGPGASLTPYGTAYVSWQLTSIRLPHSQELITFAYGKTLEPTHGRQQKEQAVRFHHNYGTLDDFDMSMYTLTRQYAYRMKLLTAINYGTTSIRIDYTDSDDTAAYNYADRIRILDGGTLVREVSFTQHQSDMWTSVLGSGLKCSTLDSVTLTGNDGSTSEIYSCEYAGTNYHFSGTDHWGYLNTTGSQSAGIANLNLFMEFDVSRVSGGGFVRDVAKDANDVSPFDKVKLANASFNFRAPSTASSHCLLKRLVYPTGGYTEFIFENHEFWSHTDALGNYIPDRKRRVKTTAAGFRIKEIADYDADGTRSNIRRYCYGPTNHEAYGYAGSSDYYIHTGAGEPTADPTIENYMSYEATSPIPMSIPYMVKGLSPQGKHEAFSDVFHPTTSMNYAWEFSCTFSVFNFRRLLDGRQPVVYPEVTVYYMKDGGTDCSPSHCEGKTVYKYDVYEPSYQDTSFFEKPQYFGNVLYYDPQPFRYNLLKEQSDYESDGQAYKLIRHESRTWHYGGTAVIGYDYSNPYGSEQKIPAYAMLYNLFTTTWRQLGHATLYSKEVETCDKETGESFTEEEQYGYAYADVLSYKSRDAGGLHREWEWIRPEATSSGTADTVVQKMIDKNMLSPVLEEIRTGYDGYKCEYGEFTVSDGNSLLLPARYCDSQYASNLVHTEILSYTSNGNPLEAVTKDGLHTVYLWGYGDRYLVGEIKNATLSEVETAVSSVFGMSVDALSKASVPDATKLKALRNHFALSEAQVSVFTYKPLVGVTSMTDPTGKTVYYDYDPLGRLKESYYYEGSVKRNLQEYEYHYTNQ